MAKARLNWPLVIVFLLAVVAIFSRLVLTRFYEVPQLIRFYLADFGSAAILTIVLICLLHGIFGKTLALRQRLARWLYAGAVVVSTLVFLNVEREDYYGIDEQEGGFDPGMIIDMLGAPNTDTFDPWDLVAITAGGILTLALVLRATKNLSSWHRFPLCLTD